MSWEMCYDEYEKMNKGMVRMMVEKLEDEVRILEECEEVEMEEEEMKEMIEDLNSVICFLRNKYKVYGDVKK